VKYITAAAEPNSNGCKISFMPASPALAMAYVPMQQLEETYDPEQALDNGTLFPALNKPFLGKWGDLR